uniref:Secreted RxLR effector peptide protein n=1 Tax=Steinernema glaseri TaxID=37863 RepID=A0A1I7Z554_9BILA
MRIQRALLIPVFALVFCKATDALQPKPSFESVVLQAIDDLPNGGRIDDIPRVEGHVSVLNALDPLLSFFRTTMPPPTSSMLFDRGPNARLQVRGDSNLSTLKSRNVGELKWKKKRKPAKRNFGVSRQKLSVSRVSSPQQNTSLKKKSRKIFKVSSESGIVNLT